MALPYILVCHEATAICRIVFGYVATMMLRNRAMAMEMAMAMALEEKSNGDDDKEGDGEQRQWRQP